MIDVQKNITDTLDGITFLQDQITIADGTEKKLYDDGIYRIDQELSDLFVGANDSFVAVGTAYRDRVVSGCRTDMFWRVTGIGTNMAGDTTYSLLCTKLSPVGYASVGYGTATVSVLSDTGSIVSYPRDSYNAELLDREGDEWFGFDRRSFYGLQIVQEPFSRDIGDTFVTSFIGTCVAASDQLTVVQPIGAGSSNQFRAGQIVTADQDGVLVGTVKITSIGTGYRDLRDVTAVTGIGTTASTLVNILTLDTNASDTVSAPTSEGSYVTFSVLDDVDTGRGGRYRYELQQGILEANPFVPQTLSIMDTSTIGTGMSVYFDQTGNPSAAQSWNPDFKDQEDLDTGVLVEKPVVGAGQSFYLEGYGYYPVTASGGSTKAAEGATASGLELADLSGMYGTSPSCSTAINDAVTTQLGISSTKETAVKNAQADTDLKIDAVNGLRLERNEISLKIFGMRQAITAENSSVDRLDSVRRYIGMSTISDSLG